MRVRMRFSVPFVRPGPLQGLLGMTEVATEKKQARRRSRRRLVKTALVIFIATLCLDRAGVIDLYGWPPSSEWRVCAVCGRSKKMECPFGIKFRWTAASPATHYCDRHVGPHEHIWVLDYAYRSGVHMDGFAEWKVPICAYGISEDLTTLADSPHIAPVVRALCDVDNYFAWVALDAVRRRRPKPGPLNEWWEENKRWFQTEHDAEKALKVLDEIYPDEQYCELWDGALITRANHREYGAPTIGAQLRRSAQQKHNTMR